MESREEALVLGLWERKDEGDPKRQIDFYFPPWTYNTSQILSCRCAAGRRRDGRCLGLGSVHLKAHQKEWHTKWISLPPPPPLFYLSPSSSSSFPLPSLLPSSSPPNFQWNLAIKSKLASDPWRLFYLFWNEDLFFFGLEFYVIYKHKHEDWLLRREMVKNMRRRHNIDCVTLLKGESYG